MTASLITLSICSSISFSSQQTESSWFASDKHPMFVGELENSEFLIFTTSPEIICSEFGLLVQSEQPVSELKLSLNDQSDYRGYEIIEFAKDLYGFILDDPEISAMKNGSELWVKTDQYESKVSLNGFGDALDQAWYNCITK